MFIRYLGVLIMGYQLVGTVVSQDCNLRLLNANADTFSRRIWSGTAISAKDIQEGLNFLHKEEGFTDKVRSFKDLYDEKIALMPDRRFTSFADTCKELHEKSDGKTSLAIRMLLEEVSNKSEDVYTRLQKTKALHEQEERDRQAGKNKWTMEDDETLSWLLNADRSIPLGATHRPTIAGAVH